MRKLVEIKGVGEVLAAAFARKGYHSVQDIAEATEAELATVSGVSAARAAQLIRSAQAVLTDGAAPEPSSQADVANVDRSPFQALHELREKSKPSAATSTTVANSEESLPARPARQPDMGSRFETTSSASDAEKTLPAAGPTTVQSKEGASQQRASPVSVAQKTKEKNEHTKTKKPKSKNAKSEDKKKKKKSKKKKNDKGKKKIKAKNKKNNKIKSKKKKSGARKKK